MTATRSARLPAGPLLDDYQARGPAAAGDLERLPGLGPRFRAITSAHWLDADFLDSAPADRLADAVAEFYDAVVPVPCHAGTLRRRAGLVRHGLVHLVRGRDPLPARLANCLGPAGPYAVPGLGPAFWSAAAQALDPDRHPGWLPATFAGLDRLDPPRRADRGPADRYGRLLAACDRFRAGRPGLTARHVDHLLLLAARMDGRDLWSAEPDDPAGRLAAAVRRRTPARDALKRFDADARDRLAAALVAGDADADADAVSALLGVPVPGLGAVLALRRLWAAGDPAAALAAFWRDAPGAPPALPAALLHLRDPARFPPWDDAVRAGAALLEDGPAAGLPPGEAYALYAEAAGWLAGRFGLHPLEVPGVLAALARPDDDPPPRPAFAGFCADTFRFLAELTDHNRRDWLAARRGRYHFAVAGPLRELAAALAGQYVAPVLVGRHGWDVETDVRPGRVLSRLVRNDFGRGVPYNDEFWVAFHRRGRGKRGEVQLFVRLTAGGLSYGLRLGPESAAAGKQFRQRVAAHAGRVAAALAASGAADVCRFAPADGAEAVDVADAAGVAAWASGPSPVVARSLPADSPLLAGPDLVGEVLLTFDRLLPLFACAVADDPEPFLVSRIGPPAVAEPRAFRRETYLSDEWLGRARELLELKRQLILQGVPGTGKTHVARSLARLITAGRPDAVHLVQFHPAYSYEEFVEGIKARTVENDGRHDVTYPVEDGLLCAVAARAAAEPGLPHVLVIDEINRGNLPRIFGELLFLLEYRDQAVGLPYSRKSFRLPANLYLIGTMNAADRSAALLDHALRRRFSFLEMPPDAGVLAAWLRDHPPKAGDDFAQTVVALFEGLNLRLRDDLGPAFQVGHSYFMVPDLDGDRLRVVWRHHVRPLLEEYLGAQPGRLERYDLDRLLNGGRKRGTRPGKG